MNEIRRQQPEDDEVTRIREIVAHHELPDFVTGFDIRFGEFDGDPAMWITFHLTGSDHLPVEEMVRRSSLLVPLQDLLMRDILAQPGAPLPFFRADYGAPVSA